MKALRTTIVVLFIALLGGLLYVATLRGVVGNLSPKELAGQEQNGQAFELSPERGRYAHVVSLAETGTYALSKDLADFVYPDVGWYDGRFYSFFAPGMAYLALPFYLLGKHFGLEQVATFGFISFVSILSLLALFFIGKNIFKLPTWASLSAVLIYGFGSTAWSYAVTMYQHQLTVFFLLSAFYAVWKFKQETRLGWVWALWVWLAYALAIAIDYPNAILLAPVMVYFFASSVVVEKVSDKVRLGLRTGFVLTMVSFVLISGMHLYHNQKEFGSWKRLSGSIVGYKLIKENNLDSLTDEQITDKVAVAQGKKDNLVKFFSEEKVPNSFGTLMFSTDRGLLFYGPIFILGFLGILLALSFLTAEVAALIAVVAVNVFVYSSWGDPWGGWAYGTRYLIPSMSVLSLFAGLWLAKSPKAWISRIVAIVLFAYSSAVALLGALTTNAIPPRVEAEFLHGKYNYLFNIDFLKKGKSGSFVYNTYLHTHISLLNYFEILYAVVLGLFILIIVVGPLLERRRHV